MMKLKTRTYRECVSYSCIRLGNIHSYNVSDLHNIAVDAFRDNQGSEQTILRDYLLILKLQSYLLLCFMLLHTKY